MKAAAFVALLGLAVPVAGQSIGASIAGIVIDTAGARVTGATITITNVANGRSQTLTAASSPCSRRRTGSSSKVRGSLARSATWS
jgi:hypothetical protein